MNDTTVLGMHVASFSIILSVSALFCLVIVTICSNLRCYVRWIESDTHVETTNVETPQTHSVNTRIKIEENKNIDCSICLDTVTSLNVTRLSECNHKFHTECLKNISKCPNCRKDIEQV